MKTRAVLALSALLASGLAVGAEAAVKKPKPVPPVCNLVLDAKADATAFAVLASGGPNESGLDIISADIATDAKTLTTVIRVDSDPAALSTSPNGGAWYFVFETPAGKFYTFARSTKSYSGYGVGGYDATTGQRATIGAGVGIIDSTKKEIRVSVPLSLVPGLKAGTKITGIAPYTQREFTVLGGGATPTADSAEGTKSYTAGAKSCVTPGK